MIRDMKIKRIFIALLVMSVCAASCKKEEFPLFRPGDSVKPEQPVDPDKPDKPVTGSFDYTRLTAENHPRVVFSREDFDAMKQSEDAVFKTVSNQIVSKANSVLSKTEKLKHELSGKRLLSVSREAELRILSCAYAYRMTGEQKYLDYAESTMIDVCSFPDWNAQKHFLDVGEMANAVGLAYDWLYQDLKPSTKELAKKAIVDFAFTPAENKVWNLNFYEADNNWNQVCNGGLISAALAVYETCSDVAKGIIEKGVETNTRAVNAIYAPDGAYPEGYSYWTYGTSFQTLINASLETALGYDGGLSAIDGFKKTGRYMVFMEGTIGSAFNYSDCAPSTVPCMALWYFAYKYNDISVLFHEKNRITRYSNASDSYLLPIIAYFVYKTNAGSLDAITAPEDNIYRGEGHTPVVLAHQNWKNDVSDKFLGIKAGKGNTSHGHLDAGSFVYDAYGVRWSADLGLQSYGTLEPYINLWNMNDGSERWTAFRYNNFNHSTITVNEKYHKVAKEAVISGILNHEGMLGAVVDMSAPVSEEIKSVVRTIYMQGDDLIVKDEYEALDSKDAEIRWTMVSTAEPMLEDGNITLKSASGKYMYLKTSSPTSIRPVKKTWSTKSTNSWDASNSGYYECGYEFTLTKGNSATVIVSLTPNE